MRYTKRNPVMGLVNDFLIDSPLPANISYLYGVGSILGLILVLQILTGVFLAMHYVPNTLLAFSSVEHIMRDVQYGWIIRYFHANGASLFFIFVYLHIGRGLYYGSYRQPRTLLWIVGIIIFLVMVITAFLGYVLPFGQMSFWGATVITNLLSVIPWIGDEFVHFIWGGFSVDNATLNRFFSLHFVLPFVLVALVCVHLLALHQHGSTNPLGIKGEYLRFHPYFTSKDLVGFMVVFLVFGIMVFFYPNALGEPDNYIPANPLVTPASIVPEFYLLPFYAILRSIPSKLLGVVAMVLAIILPAFLPFFSRGRVVAQSPILKALFWLFIINFLLLMWLGAQPIYTPFVELGRLCSVFYFLFYFILIL